ncbi:DZR and PP2Cc domain-containing protein [Ktedonobacteria bacterium brp13]|nr:DZR and PP2Cc domain-containing protein [Ktedonobacteria bacterium brp13]
MDAFQAIHYNVALLREQQVDEGKQAVHIDTISSPPPTYGISVNGISVSNHIVPYWQIGAIIVLLLLLVGLAGVILNRSNYRHRRTLKADLAAAERRATIEAQRIRQAEMEEAQHVASSPIAATEFSRVEASQESQGSQSPAPEILQATEISCPRCGALNASDAQYCGHCRLPLMSEAAWQDQPLQQPASPLPGVPLANLSNFSNHTSAEQATVVPAGGIAEQPTIVPDLSPVTEQPTIDLTPVSGSLQQTSAGGGEQTDVEKTVPYAMRQMRDKRIGFIVGTRSDPGIKRRYKPNEDSLFAVQGVISPETSPIIFGLFVVADGMGGHANGEDASRLAIQTIVDYILPRLVDGPPRSGDAYTQLLMEGVQEANLAVHQNNMEQRGDMGTTITATLQVDNIAYVANVGDSRTYVYRPSDGLHKITIDHSVVASLVEAGIIKPDDIYTHPKRHQIYRSLGEKPGVEIDTFTVQLQRGDKLLLCSDGLWDMVRDPKIEAVIKRADPNPALTGDALIQAALDGGGEDNVSVIVVQMTESVNARNMPRLQLVAKPDSVQMPQL